MDFIISLLSSLKSLKVAYLIVPSHIGFDEHQAADQLPFLKNTSFWFWMSAGPAVQTMQKNLKQAVFFKKKRKEKALLC